MTKLETAIAANAADVLRFFQYRLSDREQAADALGETLLIAWRKHRKLPDEAVAARMWLFGIARNVLLHAQRSAARKLRLAVELREAVAAAPVQEPTSDLALDVQAAVAALPAELAELVRLLHWDGFTLVEAAQLQRIPASTARSRYAKARTLLAEALDSVLHEPS